MFVLIASLFFVHPAPLDMPRAEAFLVREDGVSRLEDCYDRLDLWVSKTVTGRWTDDADRSFVLATLETEPPAIDRSGTLTRVEFAAQSVPMKRVRANGGYPAAFRRAIEILAECPLATDKPRPSRQLPHGYRNVDYWQHPTNYTSIVCTFRQEKSDRWNLAVWHLADGDDYAERMQAFEDLFLRKDFPSFISRLKSPPEKGRETGDERRERELLREDAWHSVAAYPNWHFTAASEFAVIDDLPARGFIETLTNEFATMRARYAMAVPTPIDGSNVLCVARIYASRGEYLEALATDGITNMDWSAAYWSPGRRELVAYLSSAGEAELLKTIRHEAFHQHLSYATAMIPASPWFNEGYAQYFEDDSEEWDLPVEMDADNLDRVAAIIPGLLQMDYVRFYDGSDNERRLKYRLAWSIAVFLEKGADEVRLKPFAGLKRRYLDELIDSRDMRVATGTAFKDADLLKKFVAEWKKFWKQR